MWQLVLSTCVSFCSILVMSAPVTIHDQNTTHPNLTKHNVSTLTFQVNQPSVFHEFRINQPNLCGASDVFLLVAVCSGADNRDLRQAIRETWASQLSRNTKLVFLLAQPQDRSMQENIEQETQQYRDIIQVDFIDSYKNLTLKSVAMLHWIHKYCSQAKYILKSDDDIFINVPLLMTDLTNTIHTRFIMGHFIAGAKPDRDKHSKWYTPESVYPKAQYPEYMSGCAYVISGDIIGDLVAATETLPLYWVEDVYITAMCAKLAGAKHVFNSKFGYKRRDSCMAHNVITSHRQTPEQMRTLWRELKTGTRC